jgi:GNAT superfamily N-acetyltransferase
MAFTIRNATVEDAPIIATLNNRIWPDLPTTPDRAAKALGKPSHTCVVALDDDKVVGFVDGFLNHDSQTSDWGLRWEIDLMAVAPEARGNGLAVRMITASDQRGERVGASLSRAVVRVGNIGAERSFEICGYRPSDPHQLLVAAPEPSQFIALAVPFSWIFVETLTYKGLWIEPPYENLKESRGLVRKENCDTIGLLVPETNFRQIEEAQALGFEPVNAYRLWTRNLK